MGLQYTFLLFSPEKQEDKEAVTSSLSLLIKCKMDLYNFNRFNQEERKAAVMELGTFIAARLSCGCTMYLYAMGKFFAEVVYLGDDNQIILARAFKSLFCLEPYLEIVDLSGIMM